MSEIVQLDNEIDCHMIEEELWSNCEHADNRR